MVVQGEGLLLAEQVERFARDGYAVLPEFVDPATLVELRRAYDEIIEGQVHAVGDRMLGSLTRQVMVPSASHPVFASNPVVDRGLAVAAQVLGHADLVRTFDMLIFKPPGHPHPTPWHQDWAYAGFPVNQAGSEIPAHSIQFWVALDDADAENGCMHFIPGMHELPLLEHVVAAGDPNDDSRLLALVDPESQLDLSQAVCAAIPAGGATMHGLGTPHYTPPNRSADRPRRAYIFNVGLRSAPSD